MASATDAASPSEGFPPADSVSYQRTSSAGSSLRGSSKTRGGGERELCSLVERQRFAGCAFTGERFGAERLFERLDPWRELVADERFADHACSRPVGLGGAPESGRDQRSVRGECGGSYPGHFADEVRDACQSSSFECFVRAHERSRVVAERAELRRRVCPVCFRRSRGRIHTRARPRPLPHHTIGAGKVAPANTYRLKLSKALTRRWLVPDSVPRASRKTGSHFEEVGLGFVELAVVDQAGREPKLDAGQDYAGSVNGCRRAVGLLEQFDRSRGWSPDAYDTPEGLLGPSEP